VRYALTMVKPRAKAVFMPNEENGLTFWQMTDRE
jgi:hypothetical protein